VALATAPSEPGTVTSRDIVEAVEFGYMGEIFTCTRDESRCLVVESKADVARGTRTDSLLLFDMAAVRRATEAQSQAPSRHFSPQRLVSFETQLAVGVSKVRWLDDGRISFLGRDRRDADVAQIYTFDPRTGHLRQWTHHTSDVVNYAFAANGRRLLFAALKGRVERAPGTVMLPQRFFATMANPEPALNEVNFFVQESGRRESRRIDGCYTHGFTAIMSLAPNGRSALINCVRDRVPEAWAEYDQFYQYEIQGWNPRTSNGMLFPDPASSRPFLSSPEVVFLDVATGTTRGLGFPISNQARAFWAPDGSTLVLLSNFPPVSLCAADTCPRNAQGRIDASAQFSSLSIDVASLKITLLGAATGGRAERVDWSGVSNFRLIHMEGDGPQRVEVAMPFRNAAGNWLPAGSPTRTQRPQSIKLEVVQSGNVPPEIAALDLTSGTRQVLTDYNLGLNNRAYGHIEQISWRDPRYQSIITGTILYPSNYRAVRPYPTVISFQDLDPDHFSGWHDLSARGIIIFAPDCGGRPLGREETQANLSAARTTQGCFEAAATELVRRNIADRDRVGIFGFSSVGGRAMETLTFSDIPIAAAAITDSAIISPLGYAYQVGNYGFGPIQFDQHYPAPAGSYYRDPYVGGSLLGDDLKLWLERVSFFNLDRVRTPIRFEYHDYGGVPWDTYAVLRRMSRPVEMVLLPQEAHWARTPLGAYAFREGVADWFDFWLNDHEDPDPAKREQYARWRELRNQRDAVAREPRPPLRHWTSTPVDPAGHVPTSR